MHLRSSSFELRLPPGLAGKVSLGLPLGLFSKASLLGPNSLLGLIGSMTTLPIWFEATQTNYCPATGKRRIKKTNQKTHHHTQRRIKWAPKRRIKKTNEKRRINKTNQKKTNQKRRIKRRIKTGRRGLDNYFKAAVCLILGSNTPPPPPHAPPPPPAWGGVGGVFEPRIKQTAALK